MDYGRVKLGIYDDVRKCQNGEEELLIFGYSCKLFRDDEKAVSVENGEHLIPWMGDSDLMIDRFDVRGALYDLREAECNGKNIEENLTEVELKEEELCEQERYLALYHDETQHQMDCEEDVKRLEVELASDGSFYNQVGFSYTAPISNEANLVDTKELIVQQPLPEPVSYNPMSDEDVFIPPPEMCIPLGMEVPTTVKQNKIILKTAKFIVSQGAQMEIVIKTKQAGNPMFNFLAFDNVLNAYYKHLVGLIRNGRYRFEEETETGKKEQSDQYLHPNLSQSVRPDLTPGVVSSPSRPSPHCTYSKLITKIREQQKASTIEDTEIPSPILPSSPLHPSASIKEPPPSATPSRRLSTEPVVGLVDYPSFNQTADGNSDGEEIEPVFTRKSSKGAVHDYTNIKWPPPELQMVIDKMASYIIKNGNAFEEVVRNRGDPRFEFLNVSDEFHPYYKCKIQLYTEVYGDIFKNTSKTHEWRKKSHGNMSKKAASEYAKNSGSRTISFSIKSREQEVSLTSHTTFPIESSTSEEDEEMDEEEKERTKAERAQRRQARRNKEERERKEREEFLKKERLRREKEEEERKDKKNGDDDSSGNEDLYDIFKYAQEMERDPNSRTRSDSPDEANFKQEQRKKKAAAFLSKLKDTKEEKKTPIYGPQIPPEIAAGLARSKTQSPCSSRGSSEGEKPPLPPPPIDLYQPPPPPPKSPSPPPLPSISDTSISDHLLANITVEKFKGSLSRNISASPRRSKCLLDDSNSMASVLLSGLNEGTSKHSSDRVSQPRETQSRKSRSHKKHTRQKSESWSPSSKRERKKRKRSRGSSHRRKKRRSRSRSRSRGHSKSRRSSHKKKQSKHSSHRDKEKTRKKKHKRHRSPSSVSSLPSSQSSSPSTPSTLPSESESEMEVQVIEADEVKKSSRGSSIVSLPSILNASRHSQSRKLRIMDTVEEKCSGSGGEDNSLSSSTVASVFKHSRPLFPPIDSSNSSESNLEMEKKSLFNPNTSSAMAKIAQGLRAKLNAMLEKENKFE